MASFPTPDLSRFAVRSDRFISISFHQLPAILPTPWANGASLVQCADGSLEFMRRQRGQASGMNPALNLQPLTLPDTLDPLVVDYPARLAQELGDLAIAIAAVLPGKLDNISCETLLAVTTGRELALRRAMLPERRTGATLGNLELRSDLLNAGTATRGA